MVLTKITLLATLHFLLILSALMPFGCSRDSEAPYGQSESDSLVQMIERKISDKKQIDSFKQDVLPRDFEQKIENYYPVIRKYSKRYGFDWRLIVSQILKESRFKENARSRVGAMGLMQIMPGTASEIRREMDIEFIANNPRENITAGIYHLYKQLKIFDDAEGDERLKLALAAYNAGAGRVLDAQEMCPHYKLDPNLWESVEFCLPRLTRQYWKIHLDIWELGTPPHGYFYGSNQTISYVNDIVQNYDLIVKMFQL